MPNKKTTGTTSGPVSTNYGSGKLADGTAITFLASDPLHAKLVTPTSLGGTPTGGRAITRASTTTTVWTLA